MDNATLIITKLERIIREVLACIDRYGHPQTRLGRTAEYEVMVPIPASLVRSLRASVELIGRCECCGKDCAPQAGLCEKCRKGHCAKCRDIYTTPE